MHLRGRGRKNQHRTTKECGRMICPYMLFANVEKSVLIKGIRNVILYRLTQHRTHCCLSIYSHDVSYPKGSPPRVWPRKKKNLQLSLLKHCHLSRSTPPSFSIFFLSFSCVPVLFVLTLLQVFLLPQSPEPSSLNINHPVCYLPFLQSYLLFSHPQWITFYPHNHSTIDRRDIQRDKER